MKWSRIWFYSFALVPLNMVAAHHIPLAEKQLIESKIFETDEQEKLCHQIDELLTEIDDENINFPIDNKGNTWLHLSARHELINLMELLLTFTNLDFYQVNNDGMTAQAIAFKKRFYKIAARINLQEIIFINDLLAENFNDEVENRVDLLTSLQHKISLTYLYFAKSQDPEERDEIESMLLNAFETLLPTFMAGYVPAYVMFFDAEILTNLAASKRVYGYEMRGLLGIFSSFLIKVLVHKPIDLLSAKALLSFGELSLGMSDEYHSLKGTMVYFVLEMLANIAEQQKDEEYEFDDNELANGAAELRSKAMKQLMECFDSLKYDCDPKKTLFVLAAISRHPKIIRSYYFDLMVFKDYLFKYLNTTGEFLEPSKPEINVLHKLEDNIQSFNLNYDSIWEEASIFIFAKSWEKKIFALRSFVRSNHFLYESIEKYVKKFLKDAFSIMMNHWHELGLYEKIQLWEVLEIAGCKKDLSKIYTKLLRTICPEEVLKLDEDHKKVVNSYLHHRDMFLERHSENQGESLIHSGSSLRKASCRKIKVPPLDFSRASSGGSRAKKISPQRFSPRNPKASEAEMLNIKFFKGENFFKVEVKIPS